MAEPEAVAKGIESERFRASSRIFEDARTGSTNGGTEAECDDESDSNSDSDPALLWSGH
jgi:hypothetical protein